jgi:hypothetical protein
LTTFRCRRAQKLRLAEKTPDYSIVFSLQTRRPIENGAANVWEEDPRQALVKTAHLVCANWSQTDLFVWTFFIAPSIWLLQHFAVERGDAMFVPFHYTVFLAFESCNVIVLRMMKMMSGGRDSRDEAHLMVMEKLDAMFEAGASLVAGGTASSVVDRYRQHVAANARRLSH